MERFRRPMAAAVLTGVVFAAFSFAIALGEPVRILLASLAMALLAGITTARLQRGKPLLPLWALLLLGAGGLILHTWVLVVQPQPTGFDWVAVAVVFAFPVLILFMAYHQWRSRA
jgi:hypothetical protein